MRRNKVDKEHVLSLTEGKDYGLCSPPMKAQVAVNELCRYFLGEDWYTVMPENAEQVNAEIVYEIERRYKGCKIKKKKISSYKTYSVKLIN